MPYLVHFFSSMIFLLPHSFVLDFFSVSFQVFSHVFRYCMSRMSKPWPIVDDMTSLSCTGKVGFNELRGRSGFASYMQKTNQVLLMFLLGLMVRVVYIEFFLRITCIVPKRRVEMNISQWKTTSPLLGHRSFAIGSGGREKTTPFAGRGSMFFHCFSARGCVFFQTGITPHHTGVFCKVSTPGKNGVMIHV